MFCFFFDFLLLLNCIYFITRTLVQYTLAFALAIVAISAKCDEHDQPKRSWRQFRGSAATMQVRIYSATMRSVTIHACGCWFLHCRSFASQNDTRWLGKISMCANTVITPCTISFKGTSVLRSGEGFRGYGRPPIFSFARAPSLHHAVA